MVRAPCCQEGLKKGRWTDEEDDILTTYIQANGEGSWRSVPKNAGLQRCGKSCRLRWINYLRPDLKRGNITPDEELMIIRLHASMGNRWSLIAGHLPGRTDNEIKNYWNSHLSRKILTRPTVLKAKAPDQKLSSELTADWKPRRGRSRQVVSSKNSIRSCSMPENEELAPMTKDVALQPGITEESFEITGYINEEGDDNTASLNADDSFILSSAQKPGYFTEDLTEILCSLDDSHSLNMKVEDTEVNLPPHDFKRPCVDQKIELKVSREEVGAYAASWNESKGVSLTSSAGDACADLDWKGLVNCQKLIDEDEMLSLLWDDGCNLKFSN